MRFVKAVERLEDGYLLKKSGTNDWVVMKSFVWLLEYPVDETLLEQEKYTNPGNRITIPLGFKTDFGSIPQLLWVFLNPTKYVSYILHDYLYTDNQGFTRKEADLILIEALKVEKMNRVQRLIIYLGVRIGGWWSRYGYKKIVEEYFKNLFSKK